MDGCHSEWVARERAAACPVRVVAPIADATHEREVAADSEPRRAWTGRRKLNPEEATAVWDGLMRGNWVLVDRDENGTQDVLVAIPAPPADRPARLTPDEVLVMAMALAGRANKYIAYELGVAQSTVSARLNRAMAKLAVENRAQLQQRYGTAAALESSAA